jgi:hypothetical protein
MAKLKLRTIVHEITGRANSLKRFIVIAIASLLLVIGAIGMFIPLFPGRLVATPGLVILSLYSPSIYNRLKRYSQDHPRIQSALDRIRNWLIRRLH